MYTTMAFFNLTHTGPQDPFKTASSVVAEEVPSERKTEKHETHGEVGEGQKEREDSDLKQNSPSAFPSPTAAAPTSWHRGSHTKYTELLRKHQRNPKGPTDLYSYPLTTSQMYGWWMKGGEDGKGNDEEKGNPVKQKWTQCERHAHVNSQMTRYFG